MDFLQGNIQSGLLNVGKSIHVGPYAFKNCYKLKNEYDGLMNFINHITFVNFADSVFSFGLNLFFNFVDIFYELTFLNLYFTALDFTNVGTYAAKITSDLLYKNPWLLNWNYKNSEIIGQVLTAENPTVLSNNAFHEREIVNHKDKITII